MVCRKSEQCLAQANFIKNPIRQWEHPIRKALWAWPCPWKLIGPSLSLVLERRTLLKHSRMFKSSAYKVPEFSRRSFSKHVKQEKKKVLFPDLWNTQSSESSDCAIISNNKSLLASKVASNTECFLFCILSVGWRSSKDGSPQNSKLTAPRRRGNRKGTQINTQRMTKQHSSSMYVGLLLSIVSFCLLVLELRKFFPLYPCCRRSLSRCNLNAA